MRLSPFAKLYSIHYFVTLSQEAENLELHPTWDIMLYTLIHIIECEFLFKGFIRAKRWGCPMTVSGARP